MASRPVVQNTVMTLNCGKAVYLAGLAKALRVAEFNPLKFSAVTMRIVAPKSTALIFGSGKIVITGTKSRYQALLAAHKYIHIMRKVFMKCAVYTPLVQNMVASAFFGARIDLEKLKRLSPDCSNFTPSLFPGLIWRGKHGCSMVILVFSSGKMVITGAKQRQHIDAAYERILPLLRQCRADVGEETVPVNDTASALPLGTDIDDILGKLLDEGVVAPSC